MEIVFDLDGTLFETEPCIIAAVKRLSQEMGIDYVDEKCIRQNIGKKSIDFLASIFPEYRIEKEIYPKYRNFERDEILKNGKLFLGIESLLVSLKSNHHHLYICSNGSEEYINLVLDKTGINNFFDKKVSAKYYKSKADALETIVPKDSWTVVIGDTFSDIEAAELNHFPSIGIQYGYGEMKDIDKASMTVDRVEDIYSCIKQIEMFYGICEKINLFQMKIIGINGVDTSGKTVFTKNFSKFLNSIGIKNAVLHMDDFHNPRLVRSQGNNEIDAYYENAFDYVKVVDEILNPLKEVGNIDESILCLNLDTDKYDVTNIYKIDEDMILLVEGVLLFREPLISYFDATIYIHIDFDEVIRRARIRDLPKYGEAFLQKYINKYIPVQKKYMVEEQPLEKSKVIIDNGDYKNPVLRSVL